MLEKQMLMGITFFDMDQLLANDFKRVWIGTVCCARAKSNGKGIVQEGDCRSSNLTEIIHRLRRHNHLSFKRDFINGHVSDSMKQATNIVVVTRFVTDAERRFQQGEIRCQTQKPDRVK